jgi:hypothetical protein
MYSSCAPSKLNDLAPVPSDPLTVMTGRVVPPPYGAAAHVTVVPDVHDVLLHATSSSSDIVVVGSFELKFSPVTVTEAPALTAMLDGKTSVRTGPAQSNVSARAAGG